MLARCQQPITLVHLVPKVHLFARAHQYACTHFDHRARMYFIDMADMGLSSKIAAARRNIISVATDKLHKTVGRVSESL